MLKIMLCFLSPYPLYSNISICPNYFIPLEFLLSLLFFKFFQNLFSSSVLSHSQSSSCSPSPALSTESLSSGSDYSSSQLPLAGVGSSDQEHNFTKSVSEPSICSPNDSKPSPSSSSTEHLRQPSPSPTPSPVPANASSAPATPQTSRNPVTKAPRPPPPRPSNPSPLASEATQSQNKVMAPPPNRRQFIYQYTCTY